MRKLSFITLIVVCLGMTALGQKDQEANKPLVDQTEPEWNQRAADVKRRSGKTIRLEKRVADPKRRGRVLCYQLDAYSWKLAFGLDSEYGGIVCVRRR
jgi:hypothetical protein